MNHKNIHRRNIIKLGLGIAATSLLPVSLLAKATPPVKRLPRWRGFNLLEKFNDSNNQPYQETDFQMIHNWGFDFVRLPMSYLCWTKRDNWTAMDETILKEIDKAIEYGRKYKVHVNLNLHRIPGYCVNPPAEPFNLWKDEKALSAAAYQWQQLAKRYGGISSHQLSFDLINEPANVEEADYVRVVKRIVQAIRSEDSNRLIIADGLQYGTKPVVGLMDLNIAQSTRGYGPFQLTHYKANWAKGSDTWPVPTWPYHGSDNTIWDKNRLQKETYEPWKDLAQKGVGVHVGEWGAFQYTPHDVVLAWMKDNLSIWKGNGWGWALWNFRGPFGILDSNRKDVVYENYKGHQLDKQMLQLLQQY